MLYWGASFNFICTIKKVASWNPWRQNAKWRKPPTDSTVTEPKYVQVPIFLQFQEPMNRGKYAYMGLWVKYALGKSSCVSKIPPVVPKKQRLTVSVFLSTLQLTALLLKSFRLRLHCYTLAFIYVSWRNYVRDMTPCRNYVRDMTHSYVCHDAFICVSCRNHARDMNHSYVACVPTTTTSHCS